MFVAQEDARDFLYCLDIGRQLSKFFVLPCVRDTEIREVQVVNRASACGGHLGQTTKFLSTTKRRTSDFTLTIQTTLALMSVRWSQIGWRSQLWWAIYGPHHTRSWHSREARDITWSDVRRCIGHVVATTLEKDALLDQSLLLV